MSHSEKMAYSVPSRGPRVPGRRSRHSRRSRRRRHWGRGGSGRAPCRTCAAGPGVPPPMAIRSSRAFQRARAWSPARASDQPGSSARRFSAASGAHEGDPDLHQHLAVRRRVERHEGAARAPAAGTGSPGAPAPLQVPAPVNGRLKLGHEVERVVGARSAELAARHLRLRPHRVRRRGRRTAVIGLAPDCHLEQDVGLRLGGKSKREMPLRVVTASETSMGAGPSCTW